MIYQALLLVISWAIVKAIRKCARGSPLDAIRGPRPSSMLRGVYPQLFSPNSWAFHEQIAELYGGVIKITAMFGERQLYVFDPKALNHILIKDQTYYEEAPAFVNTNLLVFGPGLFSTLGEQHKKQRKMLVSVFSTDHLRRLVPTFYGVAYKLQKTLLCKAGQGVSEVDILSWTNRISLEFFAQSGLGYSFDSLTDDETLHAYITCAKKVGSLMFKLLPARMYLLPLFRNIGSPKFRRFVIGLLPWKNLHSLRDASDVMYQTSIQIYESRQRALLEGEFALSQQIAGGKDMLSILMQANNSASKSDSLTRDEVLGQMTSLTFAATDTTSITLTRLFHQLAIHPDIQTKLRNEIIEAKGDFGELDYDQLLGLPYLDAVLRETLRLYPPATFVVRRSQKDMVLPLSEPVCAIDGTLLREIVVPRHTNIICGLLASNCNKEIWGKDAYEYKPERWLKPLPERVRMAPIPGVYSHIMSFLGGGRGCIGFKFSELEMKVIISLLVERLEFSLPQNEIIWRLSSICSPTVAGESDPKLPLNIKLVN